MMDGPENIVRFSPRVPRWQLSRPRLVEAVDHALDDGMVIVRAGTGAGKTSMLAEWARQTGRRGTWVALDETAATRDALWGRVMVAAHGAVGAPPGTVRDWRLELQRLFGDDRQVLVLDDLPPIDEAVADDLAWLARNTGCSIILATRAVSPLEGQFYSARLGPTVIGQEELALTVDETAALLAPVPGLTPDLAAAAHEQLRGWPLGTRALQVELEHGRGEIGLEEAIRAMARGLISDRGSIPPVLNDPAVRDFAARSSIAEWLTLDLARALAPEHDAEKMLSLLEAAGLGGWSDARETREFRLQPFARTALAEAAPAALGAAELRALRRRYAVWASDAALPLIAGREAAAIQDWPLLADITQRHYRSIIRLHRPEWLVLLRPVPLDRLRRLPALATVNVQLLNAESATTDRLRALATVLLDTVGPLRERGSVVDRIWRNASLLAAERIMGHYTAAGATAERLASLIARLDPEEHRSLEEFLPILYVHIGTTRLYNGDAESAVTMFRETLNAAGDMPWSLLHAGSMAACVAALEGYMPESQMLAADVEEHTEIPGWKGTYTGAGFHFARALTAIETFDAETARAEVASLDAHYSTIEHWPLMLRVRAEVALLDGTAAQAAMRLPAEIRMRSRRANTSASMRAMLAATHADLLVASGDVDAAKRALAHADDRSSGAVLAATARAALAAHDDLRALSVCATLLSTATASPRHSTSALLVRTVAAHRLGREEEAARAARQALDALDAHELRLPLALVPRQPLAELLGSLGGSELSVLDGVPELVPGSGPSVRLTRRELAVLEALADAPTVRELADTLYVSPNTVKSQLRSLYRKLGVSSRDEALAAAASGALLSAPPDD